MINELDAIDEAEQVLAQHWSYSVLPAERRAVRASMRLESHLAQHQGQPDEVTPKDVLVCLLAVLLLLAVLGRLA